MEKRVVERYKSYEGAASFNVKYDEEWHKRLCTRVEYKVIAKAFRMTGGGHDLILDLPSGAGRLFNAIKPFGKRFIEMDISHEMLKFVRENHKDAKPALGVGSAFAMPLKDQCERRAHAERRLRVLVV